MKHITKTADLSEYTDEQIKVMFQSMELFGVIKTFVQFIKSQKSFGMVGMTARSIDDPFARPTNAFLEHLRVTCEKNKIDPKLFDL